MMRILPAGVGSVYTGIGAFAPETEMAMKTFLIAIVQGVSCGLVLGAILLIASVKTNHSMAYAEPPSSSLLPGTEIVGRAVTPDAVSIESYTAVIGESALTRDFVDSRLYRYNADKTLFCKGAAQASQRAGEEQLKLEAFQVLQNQRIIELLTALKDKK